MSEETAIVPVITPQVMSAPIRMSLDTVQGFEALQRAARMFSASTLVPKAYQGNLANCVIALNIALRMQADPLMVLQSLDIIHGRPSWRATFLIAAVNNSGKYAPLRFEFSGTRGQDSWGCRAVSKDLRTGTPLIGAEITMAMAKAEGWYGKDGSKWKTMPEQMLMYRAAGFWTRTYSPDVTMGFQTTEEIEDMEGTYPALNAAVETRVANVTMAPGEPLPPAAEVTAVMPPPVVDTPLAPVTEPANMPPEPAPVASGAPAHTPKHPKRGTDAVKAQLARLRTATETPPKTETQPPLIPDNGGIVQ